MFTPIPGNLFYFLGVTSLCLSLLYLHTMWQGRSHEFEPVSLELTMVLEKSHKFGEKGTKIM